MQSIYIGRSFADGGESVLFQSELIARLSGFASTKRAGRSGEGERFHHAHKACVMAQRSLCAGRRFRRSESGRKNRPAPFEMTGWRGRREKSGEIKSRPKVMKEENTTGLTLRLRSGRGTAATGRKWRHEVAATGKIAGLKTGHYKWRRGKAGAGLLHSKNGKKLQDWEKRECCW